MAVENAQAPGTKHEHRSAGKKNARELNCELPLLPRESWRDRPDKERRSEHAEQNQHRCNQRQCADHGACYPVCVLVLFTGEQPCIHRDE